MKRFYNGYSIETVCYERVARKWTISAAISARTLLAGDVSVGGTTKRDFKTRGRAEAAALDWAKKEIDELV